MKQKFVKDRYGLDRMIGLKKANWDFFTRFIPHYHSMHTKIPHLNETNQYQEICILVAVYNVMYR